MAFLRSEDDERNLPFLEHLEELRWRLIKCVLAYLLGVCLASFLANPVLDFLVRPIQESGLIGHQGVILRVEVDPKTGTERLLGVVPFSGTATTTQKTTSLAEAARRKGAASVDGREYFLPGATEPFLRELPASRQGVIYLHPMDPLIINIKASLILGLVFALPVILYQFWAFVAPGLLPRERGYALPVFLSGCLLFPAGAGFAYWMLKFALNFFSAFISQDAYVLNDINEYLSFALTTMLSFGVVFELPLLVLFLVRIGVLKVKTLREKRSYIFVVLLVISALITPTTDPFTLLAMALPLYALFEVSLIVSTLMDRRPEDKEVHDTSLEAMDS